MSDTDTVNPTEEKADETKKTPVKKSAAKKPTVKVEKKPAKTKAKSEAKEKWNAGYIAKVLGKTGNMVRILLRRKKVKKPGKTYTWNTKAEADAVIKKLKEDK